jgi:hypothetical protein
MEVPIANSYQEVMSKEVMSKIVDCDKIPKPVFVKSMGGWNEMPVPYVEVPLDDALQQIISLVSVTEYRQICKKNEGEKNQKYWHWYCQGVKIFWMWNCAYAITKGRSEDGKEDKWYAFRIGCEHKNSIEKEIGRCYHSVKCNDCGLEWKYDSSD